MKLEDIPETIGPRPENVTPAQYALAVLMVAVAAYVRAGQPVPPSVIEQLRTAQAQVARERGQ